MQIIPESIRSLWEEWEVRVLVLLSLLWQVILIILGNRRKYSGSDFISFTVWIMYLSADWLATVSLGNLANNQGGDAGISKSKIESKDQLLQALWAPFLLLHLGGPDTITAYALEDNNLWLRHLLGLLVQVSVAFYVFLLSWGNNALTFIAIPVFVSGIIKYSERTWALRAASPQQFQDSLLSSALIPQTPNLEHIRGYGADLECVHKGYFLFPLFKPLYADLSLDFFLTQQSSPLLVKEGEKTKIGTDAFKVVEVQLGFLFDLLYTKAAIIYKRLGLVLRLVSVLSIVSALVAFHIVIDDTYSRVDVVITYFLFAGAVSLEIYAFVSLILSDWTMYWLTKGKSRLAPCVYSCISRCRRILCHKKRWSGYMGQLNLVDFCLRERRLIGTYLFSEIRFEFNLFRRRQLRNVDGDVIMLILLALEDKYKAFEASKFDSGTLKQLLSHRGNNAVKKFSDVIDWNFEVDFDHSILIWHIATEICFHSYSGDKITNAKCKASKKLSDYLFYILLMRPLMLPKWIDRMANVRDTFNNAIRRFNSYGRISAADACKMLMQNPQIYLPGYYDERRLEEARKLASQLQRIPEENKLWEVICGVWIEMLTYAASPGDWGSHAQQLRNGGELLTHVGLLVADIGFSEHGRLETLI